MKALPDGTRRERFSWKIKTRKSLRDLSRWELRTPRRGFRGLKPLPLISERRYFFQSLQFLLRSLFILNQYLVSFFCPFKKMLIIQIWRFESQKISGMFSRFRSKNGSDVTLLFNRLTKKRNRSSDTSSRIWNTFNINYFVFSHFSVWLIMVIFYI